MKKFFYIFSVLLLLIGCNKEEKQEEIVEISLTKSQLENVCHGNDFGFSLLKTTGNLETKDVLLSPLSVQVALSMLAVGSEGDTAKEIVDALGYGNDADETMVYLSELTNQLKKRDSKSTVSVANAILINNTGYFSVQPSYISTLSMYSGCKAFSYDFTTESDVACERVNAWTSDNTTEHISNVIKPSELSPSYVVVLLNAMYFKCGWSFPFDSKDSFNELFYVIGQEPVEKTMMHQHNLFYYYEDKYAQMLTMDYGNGAFMFTAILPHEEYSLSEVVESLDNTSFSQKMKASVEREVIVSIPKFEFKSETDLHEVLEANGIHEIFTKEANFGKIVSAESLGKIFVSVVKQLADIKVDESGAVASSVSRIDVDLYTATSTLENEDVSIFKANRPFVFVIHERTSGVILFMGTYTGEN